ncbi:MAG TPA: 50S ribosomal protein L35, partial [Phycisphaerae bacterium]|nr:50S ribosomal protein L35 [Phycisphaerae bacterium]
MKTHKGVSKRFKVSGRGKVRARRAGKSHLMSSKSGKRLRKLRRPL